MKDQRLSYVLKFTPESLPFEKIQLIHETGCSGLVQWDDPEGWDGEGGGRGVQDGDMCTLMADSCECMPQTTTIL